MITSDQLKRFAPDFDVPEEKITELVYAINNTMVRFEINLPRRIRYFMAQSFCESQGFTHFTENMSYRKPERLVEVWPSRFTLDVADKTKLFAPDYVRNPAKLGNAVYANRNGNGNVASGEGYLFRARGIFGLTGKANYAACSAFLYGDNRLVEHPELVAEYEAGVESAGWFWHNNGLNAEADADRFTATTEKINGSARTVRERLAVLKTANSVF